MKIKTRIFRYAPQIPQRLGLSLLWLIFFSLMIFTVMQLLAWQGIIFNTADKPWPLLALISPLLCISLFYHRQHGLLFPFFIQKHLIGPKLRLDLEEQALRSSDAEVLAVQNIQTPWWQPKQQRLQLRLNPHEPAQWFTLQFRHIFNHDFFYALDVRVSEQLIGQRVWVYYLARSHQIVQIYQHIPELDLSELKNILQASNAGKVRLDKIPTRLLLDLPKISRIEAVRSPKRSGSQLMLSTYYGKHYTVPSDTPGFDQLELALSSLIDFVAYRHFKHTPTVQQAVISKQHPYFYRNMLVWLLIFTLCCLAVSVQEGIFALMAILVLYIYLRQIQHKRVSPFLEDAETAEQN